VLCRLGRTEAIVRVKQMVGVGLSGGNSCFALRRRSKNYKVAWAIIETCKDFTSVFRLDLQMQRHKLAVSQEPIGKEDLQAWQSRYYH